MIGHIPHGCKFYWREILSANDILDWVNQQKMPKHLHGTLSFPGVYRFLFPTSTDQNGSHRSCYVGEAGKLGRRFSRHFHRDDMEARDKKGQLVMKTGWRTRGVIQNSGGEFLVQILSVDGMAALCVVVINRHSFNDPFERRLLENWAIRSSELNDHFHVLNQGIPHPVKNLFELLKAARKKHAKAQRVEAS